MSAANVNTKYNTGFFNENSCCDVYIFYEKKEISGWRIFLKNHNKRENYFHEHTKTLGKHT